MSNEVQNHEIINIIKEKMRTAITLDIKNNTLHKPAIHKLKLLPELQIIAKSKFKKEFLENNICLELKKFLEPLPDNSFPNIEIKVAVLELLKRLDIGRNHLLDSGIGKIVYFYSRGQHEPRRVRMLAKELVNKWIRSISQGM
ncbi:Transcription factor IWS1 [Dictyocoela muelleri]|nr:Transcription factor IWS1 [Dictyocoela muelleri]